MAVIYLKHPIHGSKVACGTLEAETDEANGWVRFVPGVAPVAVAPVVHEEPVPDFLAPVNNLKRGRKPKQ